MDYPRAQAVHSPWIAKLVHPDHGYFLQSENNAISTDGLLLTSRVKVGPGGAEKSSNSNSTQRLFRVINRHFLVPTSRAVGVYLSHKLRQLRRQRDNVKLLAPITTTTLSLSPLT